MQEEYTHQVTYKFAQYVANRNLICEYLVLLLILLSFFHLQILKKRSKILLIFLIVVFALVSISQAKAAILTISVFGVYLLWKLLGKRFVIVSLSLFVFCITAFNLYGFFLKNDNPIQYAAHIERLPDFVKIADVSYNLNNVESTSERKAIWSWTLKNSEFLGHGIGVWKFDVQGNVGFEKYDCNTIIRRPHNDFLKLIYEYGWISAILLVLTFIFFGANHFFWFTLPILLFSFPTERAEFIFPFILLIAPLKEMGYDRFKVKVGRISYVALISVLVVLFTFNHKAHLIYGELATNTKNYKQLSRHDKWVTHIYPYDFMLNHITKYEALDHLEKEEFDKACLLYTSPSPRDRTRSRMPSSA